MALQRKALTAAVAATVMVVVVQCAKTPEVERPLDLASAAVEIEGWYLEVEPQVYVGDALFELVNGGAELYYRFGFVQALSAQYSDGEGRSIALDLFEMLDAEAARGIFSEKTSSTGEHLEIGDEASFESYYLNVRSGRFLITVTGFDSGPETTDGLLELARAMESRLARTSHQVSTAGGEWQRSAVLFANRVPRRSATTPASPDSRKTQHLTTLHRPRHETW